MDIKVVEEFTTPGCTGPRRGPSCRCTLRTQGPAPLTSMCDPMLYELDPMLFCFTRPPH